MREEKRVEEMRIEERREMRRGGQIKFHRSTLGCGAGHETK